MFAGVKGGSGVTTVATNFAVALAQESGQSTVLIDLNLQLGDAALGLGLSSQYSTANALLNYNRLDSNYLSTLLMKHSSGLSVLAAPDKYTSTQVSEEALDRLLHARGADFQDAMWWWMRGRGLMRRANRCSRRGPRFTWYCR